jgi:hypothetical protein
MHVLHRPVEVTVVLRPTKLYTSVCYAPPTLIRVPHKVLHSIASKVIGYAAVMA